MTPIRLLLIDDHTLFRESLRRLLEAEPDFQLVGDFPSVATAAASFPTQNVDVVLLDFDLGQENGFDFISLARNRNFAGHILIVTGGLNRADVVRVLDLGVSGIFLKHGAPSDLIHAIRKVLLGETWLDPQTITTLVVAATATEQLQLRPIALTDRERQVLCGVFEGLSNKEIGARHNFSEAYVKALMQQLFAKTGVRNRSQLVRVALKNPTLYNTP
jgi:DNA-binding NarL/FixJ family response regulator